MKTCCKCEQPRPEEQYYKDSRSLDGLSYRCKPCQRDSVRQSEQRNRERIKRKSRVQRLRRYGLTPEQYDRLWQKQNGVCAGCKQECSTGRRLAVDHDHQTGEVRGLLCYACNTTLGRCGDDPDRLRSLADYLERK